MAFTFSSRLHAGIFFALATAVSLGAITTQAKIVYLQGGNALTVLLIRFVITSLLTGIWLLGRRFTSDRDISATSDQRPGSIFLVGIAWSAGMLCYLMSVQTISVSIAALIFYTYPLMVLAVSVIAGQGRLTLTLLTLFISAFIGLGLALLHGDLKLELYGVALALMAAVGATVTFYVGAKVASITDPISLTFKVSVIGLLIIVPLLRGHLAFPDTGGWLALCGATACYVIGILCQFAALSRLAPATAAFILNLEPVVSIVLANGFLGESLTVRQWIGVSIVMAVLLVSARVANTNRAN